LVLLLLVVLGRSEDPRCQHLVRSSSRKSLLCGKQLILRARLVCRLLLAQKHLLLLLGELEGLWVLPG
jgi:hypothetical protein